MSYITQKDVNIVKKNATSNLCIGMFLGLNIMKIWGNIRILEAKTIDLSILFHKFEESALAHRRPYKWKYRTYWIKMLNKKLKLEISEINEMIDITNKLILSLGFKKRINRLRHEKVKKIIGERFYWFITGDRERKFVDENFTLKLHAELRHVGNSIKDLIKYIESLEKFDYLNLLNSNYKYCIKESIDIWTIGYNETSIFIIGRAIETVIDDLLNKLMREGKLEKIKLKEIKYKDKIGILKGKKVISEKEWHELNSIRIDRNETGHPLHKKIGKNEARIVISKSILIIKKLQNKL